MTLSVLTFTFGSFFIFWTEDWMSGDGQGDVIRVLEDLLTGK